MRLWQANLGSSMYNAILTMLHGLAPESVQERNGYGISVIIPFRNSKKYPRQKKNFKWVKKYIKCHLPWAQVITPNDPSFDLAFSKCAAINEGAREATGDIYVLLDADGYVTIDSITYCARKIREARARNHRLWYVPYRRFYRLTDKISQKIINSSPCHPYRVSTPPHPGNVQNTSGSEHGHWFGALVQIMPREAFEAIGGWDERFRGWGGEDHSAMRAIDTIYSPHKTLPGQVLHLWHPMLGASGIDTWVDFKDRLWDNQTKAGSNGNLAYRYSKANGDLKKMKKLIDEWKEADS
jgi:hypothetical protein